jgi:hypothetical protein
MAEKYPSSFNRRHFLTGLGTATASASISPAEATKVIHIGPRKRLESDIEAWNVGLITAHRPELSLAENTHRNGVLQGEIRKGGFGLLHWRGHYIPSASVGPIAQHAFLVISRADDSGNLKGFCGKRVESLIKMLWFGKATTETLSCSPGRTCLPWEWLMATPKISDGFIRIISPNIIPG